MDPDPRPTNAGMVQLVALLEERASSRSTPTTRAARRTGSPRRESWSGRCSRWSKAKVRKRCWSAAEGSLSTAALATNFEAKTAVVRAPTAMPGVVPLRASGGSEEAEP